MAKKRERFSAKKRVETKVTGFIDTAIDWGSVEKFEVENADALFLDIMPFVAGDNNPGFDEGLWAYECTYWVHKNFGANPRDGYVCPYMATRHSDKPTLKCPVCEHVSEQRRNPEANEDEIRGMTPKQRNLFVVRDPVNWGPEEFKVWDISYHLFYKMLEGVIRDLDEDEQDFAEFADPSAGFTLKLGLDERSFAGHKFYEVARAGFKKRKAQYTDAIVKDTPCLDGMIKILSYKELKAVLNAVPEDEAADDTEDVVMEDDADEEGDSTEAVTDKGVDTIINKPASKKPASKKPASKKPASKKPALAEPLTATVTGGSSEDLLADDEWDDWDE